ncbi:MAG: Calx-beta domain-containing protein [Chthoniobacteraceae bacterium]
MAQDPAPPPTAAAPEIITNPGATPAFAADAPPAPTTVVGGLWNPLGPAPTRNAQVAVPPNNEVCGAIQAIAVHPTDPNILYLGAVNGGVWRTSNATAASPTWTPLTDNLASLSVGSLEFDLTDPTFQTLVAGSARTSSFGAVGGARIGVLRTTDGGNTWTTLGTQFATENLLSVAARGSIIMAGSDSQWGGGSGSGLFRSTNTGGSFALVSGTNGLPTGSVSDIVADPNVPNRFYAAVRTAGIFRSDDTGATWTNVTGNITGITGTTTKIEMGVHNNGTTNAVFVAVINSNFLASVWRSTSLGTTWTQMDTPVAHNGGQGQIHFSIAADRNSPNFVYIGGDRIAGSPFTGNLFRGDASLGLGTQFTTIMNANGGNTAPHADSREMLMDANGNLIQGDDGGLYRRTSPQSSAGVWSSVIGNLAVVEVHDVAYDSVAHVGMVGTQDNGTHIQTAQGSSVWTFISGGDGGDVAIDDTSTAGQSIRYGSSQNLGGFYRRTYNASNTLINTTFPSLTVQGGGPAITVQFATPVELNKIDPTRLIIGGSNSAYESLDRGNTITALQSGGVNGTFTGKPIAYGGRRLGVSNPDVLYYGSSTTVRVRTTAGGAINPTAAPFPGGNIQDIVLDRNDWQHVFVAGSSTVHVSTNTGGSWTNITGDLTGVGALHTLEFFPFGAADCVAVGTDTGVYCSFVGNLGTWFKLGSGFPNAVVYDMTYNPIDQVLVVGTMGRGSFLLTIDVALVVMTSSGNITYVANQVPLAIDPGLTLSYSGGSNLTGATVAITGNFNTGEDVLAFGNQNGITGNYDGGTGVLTLTGTATLANYEAALRSVSYFNSNPTPSTAVRTVTFTALDNTNSGSATRSIDVVFPGTIRFSQATQSVNAQDGMAILQVDRLGGSVGAVSVTYNTADGSAFAPADYAASINQVLNFADGENVQFIQVPVILQATVQFPKTFTVELSNPTGGATLGATTQAAVTIVDNRPPPNDDFADAQTITGGSGSVQGFDINSTSESDAEFSVLGPVVWYKWVAPTSGQVAFTVTGNGAHFAEILRGTGVPTLQFVSGQLLGKTAAISVVAGATYYIALGGGQGAFTLSWQTTTTGVFELSGFRAFFDPPTGRRPPLLIANEEGGSLTIGVRRVGSVTGTVTVVCSVVEDAADEFPFANAIAGSDFTPTSVTVAFLPGESLKLVTLPIADDLTVEASEDLVVGLSTPTGATLLGNVTRLPLVIFDNEGDPANDDVANAQPIFGVSGLVIGDNRLADPEMTEPPFSDDAAGRSVWYSWVAPLSGTAEFVATVGVRDRVAITDVFSADVGGLTLVASTAGKGRFSAIAGQAYMVRVDSLASQQFFGITKLRWSVAPGGIISFQQSSYSTREAGGDSIFQLPLQRTGGIGSGASVEIVTFDAPAISDTPTTAGQYAGLSRTVVFEPGESIKLVDITIHHTTAAPGDTSFDVILGNPTGALLGGITITRVTIGDFDDNPANNEFAARTTLAGASGSSPGTTAGADLEPGEPAHGFNSVWYSWTAPAGGLATFSLGGTSMMSQPTVAVYSGTAIGSLTPVAQGAGSASFVATALTTYVIAITEADQFGNPSAFTLGYSLNAAGSLISIAGTSVSVTEDVAGGNLEVTLTRTGSTAGTSSVDFQTFDDTAAAGSDYTASTGTVTFNPTDVTKTIAIPITNDSMVEADERFTVELSNAQGAALSPNATTEIAVTIADDDVVPAPPANDAFANAATLSGSNPIVAGFTDGATIEAGEPGSPNQSVWFKWTAPATGAATVSVGDAGHTFNVFTGSSLADLTPVSNFIGTTFSTASGTTFFIQVNALSGANPNFVVTLNFTGAGVFRFATSGLEVNEDAGSATITILRTNGSAGAVTVRFSTMGLTATSGADFTSSPATVNFADGITSQTASVPISNDALLEGDETISLLLTDATGGALVGYGPGDIVALTINDDEDSPANDAFAGALGLSGPFGTAFGDNSGASRQSGEPAHAGTGTGASIWFRWTAPATGAVTFSTAGSAISTAVAAYTGAAVNALTEVANSSGTPGEINFAATKGGIYVIAVDGTAASRGDITLTWDLVLPGVIQFNPASYAVDEASPSVMITVVREVGADDAVSVHFTTVDGSAIAGQDYTATSGDLNFADGETTMTITVPLINDTLFETAEGFSVVLSAPTNGATLGTATTAAVVITSGDSYAPDAVNFAALVNRGGPFATSGCLTLKQSATGSFTGKLILGGKTVALKGGFDAQGSALVAVARKGAPALAIAMQLTDDGQTLNGHVYDNSFDSTFSGESSFYDGKTRLYPQAGPFTLAALPTSVGVGIPQGFGTATMAVSTNGTFKIKAGQLGDSTKLTGSGFIAQSGKAHFYSLLYGKQGAVGGVLCFRDQPLTDADGTLDWFKPANLRGQKFFVPGFTTTLNFVASIFAPRGANARIDSAFDADNGDSAIALRDGNLAAPLSFGGSLDTKNKIAVTTPLPFALGGNGKTGAFSASFTQPGRRKTACKGVFLQKSDEALGQFFGVSQSGSVRVVPAGP